MAGRRVFEYHFRTPIESSRYRIKVGGEWRFTANSGSFDIDAATADLTHFVIETDVLPAEAKMCQARTAIIYQHLHIGDGDFLIPIESEFQTVDPDASRTKSVIIFSACHEYTAQSSISFGDDSPAVVKSSAANAKAGAMPAGVSISLRLAAPIDTSTAAAGDVVFATVAKAVGSPGSKEILIPKDARVRGRISEMRRFIKPPRFQIGIMFDTVKLHGLETPVTLALDPGTKVDEPYAFFNRASALPSNSVAWARRSRDLSIPLFKAHDDGGVFIFVVDQPRYVVPAGYESKWITRQLKP